MERFLEYLVIFCVSSLIFQGLLSHGQNSKGIRQEHWSGLPFPSPGDLPDPGVDPGSPVLQVVFYTAGGLFPS